MNISCDSSKTINKNIKVGYLSITPNLQFYTAIEDSIFKNYGLEVEPILFKTSNELIEALITKRIDFTTVTALSIIQSLESASPGRLKIYQVNYIPASDPNDFLLVKKGSPIKQITDLKGKKIALFPGSNFNLWAKIIFGEYFDFGDELITVSLPPQLHIQSLANNTVDAIYCLEPTASIAIQKNVATPIDTGLVAKYIFDPFPVTGNAVLTEYVENNQRITKKFCKAMFEALDLIEKNPDKYRPYLTKYCNIPIEISNVVKLGHAVPYDKIDMKSLEKAADLYYNYGLFKEPIDSKSMILKLK